MLTSATRKFLSGTATVAALAVAAGAPALAAPETPPRCDLGCASTPPPASEAGAEGGEIWADLGISGLATDGATYERAGQVKVVPRCWYRWWFTGQEYAAQLNSHSYQRALTQMPPEYRTQPLPG